MGQGEGGGKGREKRVSSKYILNRQLHSTTATTSTPPLHPSSWSSRPSLTPKPHTATAHRLHLDTAPAVAAPAAERLAPALALHLEPAPAHVDTAGAAADGVDGAHPAGRVLGVHAAGADAAVRGGEVAQQRLASAGDHPVLDGQLGRAGLAGRVEGGFGRGGAGDGQDGEVDAAGHGGD